MLQEPLSETGEVVGERGVRFEELALPCPGAGERDSVDDLVRLHNIIAKDRRACS